MTTPILSARGRKANKPSKPRKDFPLFAHGSGQWAKKVNGKLFYFGVWGDPKAAESEWERRREALLDGRDPDDSTHGDSIGWLCDTFMDSKQAKFDSGEITTKETVNDYHKMVKRVAAHFGKGRRLAKLTAIDFERYRQTLPRTWGAVTKDKHLRLVRVLFKYANDRQITDRPMPYQVGLEGVKEAERNRDAAKRPSKAFTLAEVHKLLKHAGTPMRAFVLLGVNCAYHTVDIARLRISDIDFDKQWLGVMRGKTGVARGCWLWPETVTALREAIDMRPWTSNPELDQLAFLTRDGRPWQVNGSTSHPLIQAFDRLKQKVKIDKCGTGHKGLRHTFRTEADAAGDANAIKFVMGHKIRSIDGVYIDSIDPQRVKAVCQFVHKKFRTAAPKKGV